MKKNHRLLKKIGLQRIFQKYRKFNYSYIKKVTFKKKFHQEGI